MSVRDQLIQYLMDAEGGERQALDRAQAIEVESIFTKAIREGWRANPRAVVDYLEGHADGGA
jgi:hypothetical protein